MQNYFIDPASMNLDPLLNDLTNLHSKVLSNIDLKAARIDNNFTEKYADILEREILPHNGISVDEVYDSLAHYSQGLIRWSHPGAMINVNPPASIPSVAAASYFSLYNPNGAQDMSSGYLLVTELAVVKMISQLADIDYRKSGGIFTFGGKSTNLHGVKHGLQRIDPSFSKTGLSGDIVVFSSTQGHPCHSEVCGWLGIGEDNCIRIGTDNLGVIDVNELKRQMEQTIESGKKIATIVLNGATTIQMTIDPIRKISKMRDDLVKKYKLEYVPRIHVDSVIGWAWLFFKEYNFDQNPLNIGQSALIKIKAQTEAIKDIKYADSFGVDFHKTGYCSYLSSLYITKDRSELYAQGSVNKNVPYDEMEYGNYSPFQYTLELSRSLAAPISAYVNLKTFGAEGYQKLIGGLMDTSEYFKDILEETKRFEVINRKDSNGFVTLFVARNEEGAASFFDLGSLNIEEIRDFGQYNYRFYLYLLEKQKTGECTFSVDYSTGYHSLSNGMKIGVLKAYPMSPYFDREHADLIKEELLKHLHIFDTIKDTYVVSEVPHKPRDFVFK